jgi:hypothetical protein
MQSMPSGFFRDIHLNDNVKYGQDRLACSLNNLK